MSEVTILVVDDHKPNRDMLSRRLNREGYKAITAESGMQVFEMLPEQPIQMILLDLMMPEMSGIEVLERLRQDPNYGHLPVLMVSANTDSPQMVAALDQGANDYITKPIDFEVLLAKVRRHLGMRSGMVQTQATAAPGVAASAPAKPAPPKIKPDSVKAGDTLAHYKLDRMLGEGGMGRVFKATDTRLLREVAIKIMIGEDLAPQTLERFVVEARAVARVSHPGIVTIFEIGLEPFHYISMELLDGKPLDQFADGRALPVRQAVNLMVQVLDALNAVHKRDIVHRDLKPANIMVLEGDRTKVMDFGLAKLTDVNLNLTQAGEAWGTPRYMSPEHVNPDFGEINSRSDIFAVAVILYELLTGEGPFQGRNPGQLLYEVMTKEPKSPAVHNPKLPAALCDVCLLGMRKKQAQRYQDAASFAEALRPFAYA